MGEFDQTLIAGAKPQAVKEIMHSFKDSEGRDWKIDLNLDARQVLLDQAEIDLLDVEQAFKLAVIAEMSDVGRLGKVLCVLCDEQLQERKMSARDFARALKGDYLEGARVAIEKELIDFFHPSLRETLKKLMAKAKKTHQMVVDKVDRVLESDQIERQLQEKLNDLSGRQPGSSESTRED